MEESLKTSVNMVMLIFGAIKDKLLQLAEEKRVSRVYEVGNGMGFMRWTRVYSTRQGEKERKNRTETSL